MGKILAINGSPRKGGNTERMLNEVLSAAAGAGHETELYQAGGRAVRGCLACGSCETNLGRCATDDWVNELYPKMKAADALVIGSPTYCADLTPEIKAILDRCCFLAMNEGRSLSRKIGAGVSAVRRAGSIHAIDSINHFFLVNDMVVPGSVYWAMSVALEPGDYSGDGEGVETMRRLGENIAWLLEKLK
ncbi:MAG: flavodoxin family protein [Clostridiales bacterium]|jgi:multimeric flavodoxin WrbA|nr:flavodoxin family protein [Clostridiales bacterium]